MSRYFIFSFILHIILIFALIFGIERTFVKKKSQIKRISLKHVVLKTPPKFDREIENIEKHISKPLSSILPPTPKIKSLPKIKKRALKKKKRKIRSIKKVEKKEIQKSVEKKISQNDLNISKSASTKKASKKILKQFKKDYFSINKYKIYKAIQNAKKYPIMAKRLGIKGVVKVRFTILKNGDVVDIQTAGGHKILQKAAKKTIIKASSSFPKPDEKTTVNLSIEYKLR